MKKLILYVVMICNVALNTHTIFGVIVGISCLINPANQQKVFILHDKHDLSKSPSHETVQHQQELLTLITTLKQCNTKSSFFIEWPYRTTNFKGCYDYTTVHIPIKHAITGGFNQGSLEFKSFDERSEEYFWCRESTYNRESVLKAIEHNIQLPIQFKETTIKKYKQTLSDDQNNSNALIPQLPNSIMAIARDHLKSYANVHALMDEFPSVAPDDHIIKLANVLDENEQKYTNFFKSITEAGSVYSDISLWHKVLQDNNAIAVVLAGAYHTCFLEKILVTAGYVHAFPEKNLKNGLNLPNIHEIIWPAKNTASFLKLGYQFLSLCNNCGKQSSLKCSSCKQAMYCNKACQKVDWPEHKLICKKEVKR